MHRSLLLSQHIVDVKAFIVANFETALEDVLAMTTNDIDDRQLEQCIWQHILDSAQLMMSAAMGIRCCQ